MKQGESIESIAATFGHFQKTIWEHPENEDLRNKRKSPHVLCPGDVVFIPEIRQKSVSIQTGKVNTFKRRGIPSRFRVQFMLDGEPRANESYTFIVDGEEREGTTDGDGFLNETVSPHARRATVRFALEKEEEEDYQPEPFEEEGDDIIDEQADEGHDPKEDDEKIEVFVFDLRQMDPSSEMTGAQGRLLNLGYPVGAIDGEKGPRTTDALRSFQKDHGLEATGELDENTQAKLSDRTKG